MSKRKSTRTTSRTTSSTASSTPSGTASSTTHRTPKRAAERTAERTASPAPRERRSARKRRAAISPVWSDFGARLVAALDMLPEKHYLVLTIPGRHRFVQFAQQGSAGIRAECVSNAYLAVEERLTPDAEAALGALGWLAPTQLPFGTTVKGDPDGSPHWFHHFDAPADGMALAALTVRTFGEVYGVEEPGALRYNAFESAGPLVLLPLLGIKHERGTPFEVSERELGDSDTAGEESLPTLPFRVVEAAVWASEDGLQVIGTSQFALRVDGIDLRLVVEAERYVARIIAPLFPIGAVQGDPYEMITTMNAEHIAFGYVYARDGEVRYAAELLLEPFYPALVPVSLKVAASVVRALRGENDDDTRRWTLLHS